MRLAIQKDVECANVAENVVRVCQTWASIEYGESLDATQGIVVKWALDDIAVADLAYGRVLSVNDEDGTAEWRIMKIRDSLREKRVTVEARPIIVDLSQVLIYATIAGEDRYTLTAHGLTPDQWIDNYVLPALTRDGITWITKGTITPTEPITLQLDHATALGLLRDLVVGTIYDVVLRRNGVTDYKIDLVRYNYTETKPLAWVGDNVESLEREIGGMEVTTIAKPVGIQPASALERATVAGTLLKVTARSGTSWTIKDPRDNGDVIAAPDDHLNGQYLTVPLPHGALGLESVGTWGAWAAYSVLKDRLYVFDATTFFFGHEIHPATGEITAYLDNALFSGESGGISAVAYVPKGTSGKIWIWTGSKILELDCAALTVATVRASGAVQPTTRPTYHSGQDAVYYTNGSTMHKYLAASPFTASTVALTNAVHGMAYASSVALFYCATNAASPAFRTFNPATSAVASVTPTGAGTYTQIEYDSGQDRLVCSDDSDNGGNRLHLVNPNTNAITDTLTVSFANGEANFGLNWGGTTDRLWSVAGGGKAWFTMKVVNSALDPYFHHVRLVQVDVAVKTAVQLDHARFQGILRCTAYESDRAVVMLHGRGFYTIDPSAYCWEAKVQVSDTVDATDVVVVASREKLVEAGSLIGVAAASDGRRMTLMKHGRSSPAEGLIGLYGPRTTVIDLAQFRGEKNLCRDPYFNEWFSAAWPKYPSHSHRIDRSVNGSPYPGEKRAQWSEYPASTVTVHSFLVNGAHGIGAFSIALDGGPASTVMPVGARLVVPGNAYRTVMRRAITDGAGVVTLIVDPLTVAIADNDAATVRVPPLGTTAPNGVATYTTWAANSGYLGRSVVIPTAYPDAMTGDELYTLRFKFGGYWGGAPKDCFQVVFGGMAQDTSGFGGQFIALEDDFVRPLGVQFLDICVGGYLKPGVYFFGISLLSGISFTLDNFIVGDRLAVLQGVEPGTLALPPFTEYSHANQLWRAGKELLESGLQTYYALEVLEDDALRKFKVGSRVDIRDKARNIFTTARLTNRRFAGAHPESQTVRKPIITVDTHVPSFAHLEPGPEGELSLSPPDAAAITPPSSQTVPPPPVPPVPIVVTNRIEVYSTVSLLEGVAYGGTDVVQKTWDPVPFDALWGPLIGTGLTLQSDGRILVATRGQYAYEFSATFGNGILWDPVTPTYYLGRLFVTATAPTDNNQQVAELHGNPSAATNARGITPFATGTIRVNAGAFIKAVVVSRRSEAGNHRVDGLYLNIWRVGDLP